MPEGIIGWQRRAERGHLKPASGVTPSERPDPPRSGLSYTSLKDRVHPNGLSYRSKPEAIESKHRVATLSSS